MADDAEMTETTPDPLAETSGPAESPADQAEPATDSTAGEARGAGTDLEQEGEVAADYLEGLLDILDLDGDLDLDVEGQRASVAILGDGLEHLVGPGGAVLESLQELTRLAVLQQTGSRSRLMLDIGGFRAQRRTDLEQLAGEVADRVRSTGEPERMTPMTPFERKVVHDAIAAAGSGLVSESEGEEPERRVVVRRG